MNQPRLRRRAIAHRATRCLLLAGLVTAGPAWGQAADDGNYPGNAYQPGNKVTITAAVLDRFTTGLRAELAERDRLRAAAGTDANVRAHWRFVDRAVYCDSLKDALAAEQQTVIKQLQSASTEAQMNAANARMQKILAASNQSCEPAPRPELEQSFFDNLRRAESGMDQVGAQAAGLTRAQYAYMRERIAALVLGDRSQKTQRMGVRGYAPEEVAAIRARGRALAALLARDFNDDGARNQPVY